MNIAYRTIAPGVTLCAVENTRFKTSVFSMTLLAPMRAETTTENALLPAILRRGTRRYPNQKSLSAALDACYGASIEPMLRQKGETQCFGFLASFPSEAYLPPGEAILDDMLSLMAELLFDPVRGTDGYFSEDIFAGECENLSRRHKNRINDKQQYALYRLSSLMCEGEGYGLDKWGEPAALARIRLQGLWAHYERLLEEAPIHLYYCGAVPIDVLAQKLVPLFTGRARKEGVKPAPCTIVPPRETRYFTDRLAVSQGKLSLGFRLPAPQITAKAAATLMVFQALYGGSTNAKLFLHVRERLSLCYYASSMIDRLKGLVIVNSGIAFADYERARDEILAQLRSCYEGGLHEEELLFAKEFVKNQLRLSCDAPGRLEDFWLTQKVAERTEDPLQILSAVETVTQAEVEALSRSLWLDAEYFLKGEDA